MGNLSTAAITKSNMTNAVEDRTVNAVSLEGPTSLKETTYTNSKWTQYLGYYKKIPEVKIAIDMRSIWTVGKNWEADPRTTVILDHLKGWGNDTFNSILKNMIITRRIGGDAFAEIIRDEKSKILLNLKPLDAGSIRTVVDGKGIIKRYEKINKIAQGATMTWKPKDIFHLVNKRIGDEIHGVSDIEAIEEIIKAQNESFFDMKELQHRFVRPKFIVYCDTDDEARISSIVGKFDQTVNKGENIFVPEKTVRPELLAVPSNSTLNPLPWRQHLRDYFFQVVGLPQIVLGGSGEFTEATAKIAYLAFQQSVEDEQQDIQDQIWNQLYLKVKLKFPASMQNELISDEKKDSGQATGFQQNDTTAGVGE